MTSRHMCHSSTHMRKRTQSTVPRITVANKALVPVQGEGEILFEHQGKDRKSKILLQKVLHVPNLTSNLASVSMIVKGGNEVIFLENKCKVFNAQDKFMLTGHLNSQNIYKLDMKEITPNTAASVSSEVIALQTIEAKSIEVWHRRLGHLNAAYMKQLQSHAAVGIKFLEKDLSQCEICISGKLTKQPFHLNLKRVTE